MRERLIGLEVVRALAALIVIWGHAFLWKLLPASPMSLPGQFSTEAVICFFVLSGAVITIAKPSRPSRAAAIKAYVAARALRIYPIYLAAIAMALGAAIVCGDRIDLKQYLAHLVFLQSKSGYPFAELARNQPLWSLANEVIYYALFIGSFFSRRFMLAWTAVAVLVTFFVYPFAHGLLANYLSFAIAMSLPWLMGHWLVVLKDRIPKVPLSVGLCLFAIGICYARAHFIADYYDPFRLDLFALGCAALVLSIIQGSAPATNNAYAIRIAFGVPAIALLWATGIANTSTKAALTGLVVVAMIAPIEIIVRALRTRLSLRPLVFVGGISYAIYAVHMPIMFVILALLPSWNAGLRFALFALCVLLIATFLEKSLDRLRGAIKQRRVRAAAPAAIP